MIIPPLQPDLQPDKSVASVPQPKGPACMNCGATLKAKFCHVCGQRKQRLVVSLFAIIVELIEGIFDIESRLWRTLWPLFARPGQLTKSFMEGKRERYLPPVRLYLISSIIFFLLVSLSPRNILNEASAFVDSMKGVETSAFSLGEDSKLTRDTFLELARSFDLDDAVVVTDDASDEDPASDSATGDDSSTTVTVGQRDVVGVDSESQGGDTNPAAPETPATDVSGLQESNTQSDATSDDTLATSSDRSDDENTADNNIAADDLENFEVEDACEEILNDKDVVAFEILRMPLYRGCISISTWGGFLDFLGDFIDDLPKTLLILLPLMAIVNKFLYLFAGRYYVEHLLYYVHNYSFLFLFSVLLTGIGKLSALAGADLSGLLFTIGFLYTIYYFFKSMRVVYGQGFFFTLVKWSILNVMFFVLVLFVIVFFTLVAAAVHGI